MIPATYDASMTFVNEPFTGDLSDPSSDGYQQFTNDSCQQVHKHMVHLNEIRKNTSLIEFVLIQTTAFKAMIDY